MLSPFSTKGWILISRPVKQKSRLLDLAIDRINGLRNPVPGEEPSSPEFDRFLALYERLRQGAVLDIVQAPECEGEAKFFWDIHDYEDAHADSVREFLDLLGIEAKLDGSPVILPLRESIGRSTSSIHVQMRSAYELLRALATGIEIPSAHLEAGIVEELTSPLSEDRRFMTIRSSEEAPDGATVQIRFRDRWFYIDATDTRTKRAFAFTRTFIGMRLAGPGATQGAPVLTVPVN